MIYGNGTFVTRDVKYVVRRDGVASPFLYLGARDCHGNRSWVEELTDAAVFAMCNAQRFVAIAQWMYDDTVVMLSTTQAAADHIKKVEEDCVNDF